MVNGEIAYYTQHISRHHCLTRPFLLLIQYTNTSECTSKELILQNRRDGSVTSNSGRNGIENFRVAAEIAFRSPSRHIPRFSAAISISRVFPASGDTIDGRRVVEKYRYRYAIHKFHRLRTCNVLRVHINYKLTMLHCSRTIKILPFTLGLKRP